ncbi:MAG: penicillin-binding transpeptidase domain-containing protein [Bryobacteraceae bacterium]
MRRRDWLLSTLALAPVGRSSATPSTTPAVDAVVLDGAHRILFEHGAARLAALPGSTLKPFVLAALLERKLLRPDERLACPGGFHLGRHNLECSHVHGAPPFDGAEALAASCNFWFATMARRLGASGLLAALRHYGLAAQLAATLEDEGLQALGLAHVSASPWTLARAYDQLLRSPPPPLVAAGLRAAVERGTGQRALSTRVLISGKTGTAHGERPGSSVGWFAGWAHRMAPLGHPITAQGNEAAQEAEQCIVFAVRVPGGTGGGEAADQARLLAERWASGHLG